MTLVLTPADKPGHARLAPRPGTAGFTEPCYITVEDTYSGRFLVGPDHWHPEPHWWGPYSVQADGALLLGAEIVNEVEEYATIRISLGSRTATLQWPDTILPSLDGVAEAQVHARDPSVRQAEPDPEPAPKADEYRVFAGDTVVGDDPDPEPAPQADEYPPSHSRPNGKRPNEDASIVRMPSGASLLASRPKGKRPNADASIPWFKWFLLILVMAAAILVSMWYFLYREVEPRPPIVVDSCGFEELTAQNTMPDLRAALNRCGVKADPNSAFQALEDRERAGEAEALLTFGHLYNPDYTDPLFEDALGMVLQDDVLDALRYSPQ
ncbi:MAG: hypothetical protein GDA36_07505 [Rhodobacteraceae bacterium]|nr:hypothetical protein [Paracoccaceae bacterium]